MDENFKMSPPGFIQLYVIHASLSESSIPAVLAFLEKKNQAPTLNTSFREDMTKLA